MKVMVVGGGGREHALIWKLAQSPRVRKLYCAPGNPGIARLADCQQIAPDDSGGLASFAQSQGIDLTIVGPELPLALGIVDLFEQKRLRIFGPRKAAAKLESSKVFAKQFMETYKIPTARARAFHKAEEAIGYAQQQAFPLVIKADGLAAGKGVVIAQDQKEAAETIVLMMRERLHGSAGDKIVIEEFLAGEEATVLALTDGRAVRLLPASQDHKRLLDGDCGANTGGMGAYAPAPVISAAMEKQIVREIIRPTLEGLVREGCAYTGILYLGLMVCSEGPRVLEFNCRLGDPEAQAVLPLLRGDFLDLAEAAVEGRVDQLTVESRPGAAVCVVLASPGYPDQPKTGLPVRGLERAEQMEDVFVFHAGTQRRGEQIVTSGGRVLGITALGGDFQTARDRAYAAVANVSFDGMHFRRDIAARAIH